MGVVLSFGGLKGLHHAVGGVGLASRGRESTCMRLGAVGGDSDEEQGDEALGVRLRCGGEGVNGRGGRGGFRIAGLRRSRIR
jgi:hypothetical protein